MNEEKPNGIVEQEEETLTDSKLLFKVILYNDDWHTFDEVIAQLVKAVNCTIEQARAFAYEVHVKGLSIVFTGELSRCLKISAILEEIELHTQVAS